ncbi:MAG TPA: DUF2442 domain-containing protein [Rhizomicrobium sp.]|nr:DUF2442 domain-containing protein [Rhizomicrobium sp.]
MAKIASTDMNEIIQVGNPLPSIEKVRAETGYRLRIKFRGKSWRVIALDGLIARYKEMRPLEDAAVFKKAKLIDWGAAIGWPGDLDLGASTLWQMSEEQQPFTTAGFVRWQQDTGLSNAEAADALGLSLATIKNYRSGANIPAAVAIACRAMAAEPATLAAHYRPRRSGRPKLAA